MYHEITLRTSADVHDRRVRRQRDRTPPTRDPLARHGRLGWVLPVLGEAGAQEDQLGDHHGAGHAGDLQRGQEHTGPR